MPDLPPLARRAHGALTPLRLPSAVVVRHARRAMALAPSGLLPFVCVGLVGLTTQLTVLTALLHLGVGRSAAWLGGLVVATAVTWSLNRRYTFAGTGRRGPAEIGRYALVVVISQGVNFAVFSAICDFAPHLWPQVAAFIGAVVATLFSYTGQRFFTFAPARGAS